MSKIGRKPIPVADVKVDIAGQEVHYKGKKSSGSHTLPASLKVELIDNKLVMQPVNKKEISREVKTMWGTQRALLANKLIGAQTGFEKQLQINGLGFKAILSGKKLELSLGYSHKINFVLPDLVTLDIDKTGQLLTFKSTDKELVGAVCDHIRRYRPPEPYKGTGIKRVEEVIRRKAGKAKTTAA